jgi:hypothetical protein
MKKINLYKKQLVNQIDTIISEIKLVSQRISFNSKGKFISNEDIIIGIALKRSIVTRIASMFDNDDRSISLYQLFGKSIVNTWKNKTAINEIISYRHKYIGHYDFRSLKTNPFGSISITHLKNIIVILENIKEKIEIL